MSEDQDKPEMSEGGSKFIYHEVSDEFQFRPPEHGGEMIEPISTHIEKYWGEVDQVYHEIVSDMVHIDVHHIPPTKNRNYHVLVTSGMSEMPMNIPKEFKELQYGELYMCLPASWQFTGDITANDPSYWPFHWLRFLAKMPHTLNTWLSEGHTIPNGSPGELYKFAPNTEQCCLMLTASFPKPEFGKLTVGEKEIYFWFVIPLYESEMDYKLKKGYDNLMELFWKHFKENPINAPDAFAQPDRINVTLQKRKKFWGLF